ncbi:MAG: aspartate kinase [Phycisphaeraceae bacterium]
MAIKVCKFGGTSLADASQIRKVREIIRADPERRYVVPSAPGKRSDDDRKITDLLYLCHEHARERLPFGEVFELIAERYRQIIADLDLSLDLEPQLAEVKRGIAEHAEAENPTPDYAASRGEYLNGHIIAAMLDYAFVDPAEMIFFGPRGRLDEDRTYEGVSRRLAGVEKAVVPGFYGTGADGKVKTFSRGGSDVTGAIVARGAGASIYENWTDVSGLLMADPRIVDNPRTIEFITYRELRELSYMGARVLHDEAVFPVRRAGIPVNIRNTNDPEAPGTIIFHGQSEDGIDLMLEAGGGQTSSIKGTISGVAGQKHFTVLTLEKAMMNAEIGFGRRVMTVLESNGVNFEHIPSGIDTMSVVVASEEIEGKTEQVVRELEQECHPDSIEIDPDMALIATVGRGMAYIPGMAARLFAALASEHINIRMIDQGSSELNIIVGVDAADFENAIRAIYAAFVSEAAPAR